MSNNGDEMENKTFADNPPADQFPKIEYIEGRICLRDVFRGTIAFPLRVEFVYRPYTYDEMVASIPAEREVAKAMEESNRKNDSDSAIKLSQTIAKRQRDEVVARLVSWDLKANEGGEVPAVSLESVNAAPAALIAFIASRIAASGRAIEDIAKNSEAPSSSS